MKKRTSVNLILSTALAVAVSCFAAQSSSAKDAVQENLKGVSQESLKVLKDDAEGRTTISYSRFYATNNSGIDFFYMRASSVNNGEPYIGTGGGGSSYYKPAPLNWRMIQADGYRLLKNSLTGKCISINTTPRLYMRTCDSTNPTQKLTLIEGLDNRNIIKRQTSLGSIYLFYLTERNGEPIRGSYDNLKLWHVNYPR